jgi:protoporphyrinogen IX oxidase
MNSWYAFSKAMHLIGMVSWMAGVFYLVRIMVNHAEAYDRSEPDRSVLLRQYKIMEWKAYRIIIVPAVIITWSFGVTMLCLVPGWMSQGWMHVKLLFLTLFTAYTHYCKTHIKRLEKDTSTFTHAHYRVMNEIPTLILVGVVFLAVFKQGTNWYLLLGGLGVFSALILYAIRQVSRRKH